MAFFAQTDHQGAGLLERATSTLAHWLSDATETLARRRIARVTYTELSNLGDRELADLGMTRSDLRRVASEAAEGRL